MTTVGAQSRQWDIYGRTNGKAEVCLYVYLRSGPPAPSTKYLDEYALCAQRPGRPEEDPIVVMQGMDANGNDGAFGGVVIRGVSTVEVQLADGKSVAAAVTPSGFFLMAPLSSQARVALLRDRSHKAIAHCSVDYPASLGPLAENCVT